MTEAHEITIYLKTLEKHFELLENTHFSEVDVLLLPLMHTVCLVWSHSRYYCNSSKIIVLIKEICNLLIQEVCENLFYWLITVCVKYLYHEHTPLTHCLVLSDVLEQNVLYLFKKISTMQSIGWNMHYMLKISTLNRTEHVYYDVIETTRNERWRKENKKLEISWIQCKDMKKNCLFYWCCIKSMVGC